MTKLLQIKQNMQKVRINELSEKVKLFCQAVCNIRAVTIFKLRVSSCKKNELHMNSTSNTFQRKNNDFN